MRLPVHTPVRPTRHRDLGPNVWLRPRRPHGPELAVIEVVHVPDDADSDEVMATQATPDATGGIGPHAIGILRQMRGTRRLRPHEMARQQALGRLTSLTEPVDVWEVYRVVNGRPVRAGSDQDTLDSAVRMLARVVGR